MIDFSLYVERFKKNVPDTYITPRGVMFSEGFAMGAAFLHKEVDLIIESGVAYGGSTEMFAQMCPEIPILGFDTFTHYDNCYEYAAKRLAPYANVTLMKGDVFNKLPTILENLPSRIKRIGVFIDGPKNDGAVVLSHRLYDDPRFQVAGIHDINSDTGFGDLFKAIWPQTVFWADTDQPYAEYRELIDTYKLEESKKNYGPSPSSLDRAEGMGYIQNIMVERPQGLGLALMDFEEMRGLNNAPTKVRWMEYEASDKEGQIISVDIIVQEVQVGDHVYKIPERKIQSIEALRQERTKEATRNHE
tara:strand:+ start:2490 stop:3398 length:909 start_codon:yes stop_codon:yes gene_type:complete